MLLKLRSSNYIWYVLGLLLTCVFFTFCKKTQDPFPVNLPETSIFVDKIDLPDSNRLPSKVRLRWFGNSEVAQIIGYEFSFDQRTWFFTNRTDSLFTLPITDTSGKQDFPFWVRSVDHLQQKDPTPAFLKVPVKNSVPTIVLDKIKTLRDTVYLVGTIGWTARDPDGDNTIDSIFIKANNSKWFALPSNTQMISFLLNNPKDLQDTLASVYKDVQAVKLKGFMQGLHSEAVNRIYIRVKDAANAYSKIDSTGPFYLKAQKSDVLLIESHIVILPPNPSPASVLFPLIQQAIGSYDYLNLTENSNKNIPDYWEPTFGIMLKQYNKVIWVSDNQLLTTANLMPLELAGNALTKYLNNGGKLLVTTSLPSLNTNPKFNIFSNTSSIFSFSPMDSVSTSTLGSARLLNNKKLLPQSPISSLSPLVASINLLNIRPFYPKISAEVWHLGEITRVSGWVGPDVIAAVQKNPSGKINQVFFALELHQFNGDPDALKQTIDYTLNQAFNW